jgi:hypothetical protein
MGELRELLSPMEAGGVSLRFSCPTQLSEHLAKRKELWQARETAKSSRSFEGTQGKWADSAHIVPATWLCHKLAPTIAPAVLHFAQNVKHSQGMQRSTTISDPRNALAQVSQGDLQVGDIDKRFTEVGLVAKRGSDLVTVALVLILFFVVLVLK